MQAEGESGGIEALLTRLRTDIERRKRGGLHVAEVVNPISPVPVLAPSSEQTVRLQEARSLLARALGKNDVSPAWPQPLRGLRRNQSAVNTSLAGALGALLEMVEWIHRTQLANDSRIADGRHWEKDGQMLRREWEEASRAWERRIASWEGAIAELERRMAAQAKQIDELTRSRRRADS